MLNPNKSQLPRLPGPFENLGFVAVPPVLDKSSIKKYAVLNSGASEYPLGIFVDRTEVANPQPLTYGEQWAMADMNPTGATNIPVPAAFPRGVLPHMMSAR